jgi:hyperosmotically inducible protein
MMRTLLSVAVALTLVAGPTVVTYAADSSFGEKLDDATITTKVKAKLTKERPKNLIDVKVETNNGVVHLQGTVPTASDKAEAESLARSTSGVRGVTNDLQIASTSSATPSASPGTSPPPTKY